MALFSLRTFAPLLALAVGSWVGLGKPPRDEMIAYARPRLELAYARVRAEVRAHLGSAAPDVGAPQKVEAPYQTVDASQLPEPGGWPKLNAPASMKKAWLLAEGPARPVDTPHRLVTLTFDDGPHPESTPAVLKLLARHHVRATFFFIGRYLEGDDYRAVEVRAVAKEVAAAGHVIGNHSHDHHLLTLDSHSHAAQQIDASAAAIERVIGRRPNLFRPPYGQLDPWLEGALRQRGMELVLWSIEVGDMKRRDVGPMATSLKVQLDHAGGGMVLLHDIRPTSVHVLEQLLDWLDKNRYDPEHPDQRGYEVVDLVSYMRATAAAPQPYADRAALERARSDDWHRVRPRHVTPAAAPRNEGHDDVL